MGDHELPMHDYDNMPPPAGKDGFSNYQFTFNCAASGSNSGGTSFIEPDVCVTSLAQPHDNVNTNIDTLIQPDAEDMWVIHVSRKYI